MKAKLMTSVQGKKDPCNPVPLEVSPWQIFLKEMLDIGIQTITIRYQHSNIRSTPTEQQTEVLYFQEATIDPEKLKP